MTEPLAAALPRTLLRVWGRDPVKMVNGLATADIAAAGPERAVYTAFLTPKGRMIADALVLKPAAGDPGELLLATDPGAAPGLVEHLRKFIPPLFARFEDVTERWRVIGVYGAGASAAAERALGAAAPASAAGEDGSAAGRLSADAAEDAAVPTGGSTAGAGALAVRSRLTGGDGWELFVPSESADGVWEALRAAGASSASEADLDALRVAAGRPRWGAELTEEVIPLEAGLLDRAISQGKGCYTGQEVIVRILHRGHVNRHLRALTFPSTAPDPGTALFEPGNEKPRGVVTSARGDRGLGYVRREVEPPAELRAGSPDGPPVHVSALP